ncbi:MAG: hypothetical protein ABMA26_00720 [Limisphaerales bacterium]
MNLLESPNPTLRGEPPPPAFRPVLSFGAQLFFSLVHLALMTRGKFKHQSV